ncbi:hypothetical protein, partial [Paenibacillus doosanensis]|uniref:hypothetical protein n=1 Tax=Paenibacillus doosanensis TaxID=1229154 RepID=UPI0035C80341
ASHEPRKETPGSLFAFFAMALVDPLIPLTRDAVNCDPFSKPYLRRVEGWGNNSYSCDEEIEYEA